MQGKPAQYTHSTTRTKHPNPKRPHHTRTQHVTNTSSDPNPTRPHHIWSQHVTNTSSDPNPTRPHHIGTQHVTNTSSNPNPTRLRHILLRMNSYKPAAGHSSCRTQRLHSPAVECSHPWPRWPTPRSRIRGLPDLTCPLQEVIRPQKAASVDPGSNPPPAFEHGISDSKPMHIFDCIRSHLITPMPG